MRKGIYTKNNIFLILAIAFCLRLLVAFLPVAPVSDCYWYHQTALSIAQKGTFALNNVKTAYRMPGYPFILSIIYKIFGPDPLYARLLNVFFGLLMVFLCYILAKMYFGKIVAERASLLVAIYPEIILYVSVVCPEVVFAAMLVMWLISTQFPVSKKIISGVIVGFMSYIKPIALPLAILPILWDRRNWKLWFASFVIAFAMVLPWGIRNYNDFGKFAFTSNLWVNLWIGNGGQADGGYFDPPDAPVDNEFASDEWFKSKLLSDLAKEPLRPFLLIPLKAAHFAIPAVTAAKWGLADVLDERFISAIVVLLTAMNLLVGVLFALCVVKGRVKPQLLWVMAYFLVISLVFFGNDRFRFPIISLILISLAGKCLGKEEK